MHCRNEAATTAPTTVRERVRTVSTATLGWRDLPADAVVTVTLRYSTAYLHHVEVTYDGATWTFTVTDPARGLVRIDDCPNRAERSRGAKRAVRSALDRVGVKLTRE